MAPRDGNSGQLHNTGCSGNNSLKARTICINSHQSKSPIPCGATIRDSSRINTLRSVRCRAFPAGPTSDRGLPGGPVRLVRMRFQSVVVLRMKGHQSG